MLNWELGGYSVAWKREQVLERARDTASRKRWVMEGIYG
ncbi:hypothetical protein AWB74_07740 [Caballeronia arvi]|uniref:Uncharacterized protein n=1 Tax=Caballeronia arvi TaxID=1777135 RepID=A0A158KZI7_9BURK|nr:hypothetical protein AWB74_07740 [Caballeronia arvi]